MKNLVLTLGLAMVVCSGAYTLTNDVHVLIAMVVLAGIITLWFIYEMIVKPMYHYGTH